ncbi:MAG: hypothetical protein LBH91_03110 [Prevotellaceae bacterium]|nr:hypothetical protein [Prevotellaceae bacterium]
MPLILSYYHRFSKAYDLTGKVAVLGLFAVQYIADGTRAAATPPGNPALVAAR